MNNKFNISIQIISFICLVLLILFVSGCSDNDKKPLRPASKQDSSDLVKVTDYYAGNYTNDFDKLTETDIEISNKVKFLSDRSILDSFNDIPSEPIGDTVEVIDFMYDLKDLDLTKNVCYNIRDSFTFVGLTDDNKYIYALGYGMDIDSINKNCFIICDYSNRVVHSESIESNLVRIGQVSDIQVYSSASKLLELDGITVLLVRGY